MEKITIEQLGEAMRNANRENRTQYAVIVYTTDSFNKPFTERERSYQVNNDNRRWQSGKISNSVFGSCLDGTDYNVRLDWYIGKWKIDYCYLIDKPILK